MKGHERQEQPKPLPRRDAKKHSLMQTWKVLGCLTRPPSTAGHPNRQLASVGKRKTLNSTAEAKKGQENAPEAKKPVEGGREGGRLCDGNHKPPRSFPCQEETDPPPGGQVRGDLETGNPIHRGYHSGLPGLEMNQIAS